ncbi:MAG: hypothetical protein H7Y03_02350 [Chitinophagaceae bacterium]|nr:hypothetical protein [Chitinophagaceae bacterium]
MNYKLLGIPVLVVMAACGNMEKQPGNKKQYEVPELRPDKKEPEKAAEIKYAFIRKIESEKGKNVLKVDYVEYLTGDEALKKAKTAGDAHYVVDARGDTAFSLVDGYYIFNASTSLQSVELDKNAAIDIVDYTSTASKSKDIKVSELKNVLKNEPLMILSFIDGKVVNMTEQYRP